MFLAILYPRSSIVKSVWCANKYVRPILHTTLQDSKKSRVTIGPLVKRHLGVSPACR